MMKQILIILFLISSISSCNSDKQLVDPLLLENDISNKSDEELKALGFTISENVIPGIEEVNSKSNLKTAKAASNVYRITPDYLNKLGISLDNMRNNFTRFCKSCCASCQWVAKYQPDGFWFNGHTLGGGRKPPHDLQEARLHLHKPWVSPVHEAADPGWFTMSAALGAIHRRSQPTYLKDKQKVKQKFEVWHTVTKSIKLQGLGQAGIFPLRGSTFASPSNSFGGINIELGLSEERRNVRGTEYESDMEIPYIVPANTSNFRKVIQYRNFQKSWNYKQGYNVSGQISANYPHRVHQSRDGGHSAYFWYYPALEIMKGRNRVEEGAIQERFREFRIVVQRIN